MPTYCYKTPKGKVVERFFHVGEAPEFIIVKDQIAPRDMPSEWAGRKAPAFDMESLALAVHPKQLKETVENDRKFHKGCAPDYYAPTHDGLMAAHWTGHGASVMARRRRYERQCGFVNKDFL